MTATTGASETWQARITHDLAAQLRADAEVLGLEGRTEIVRAALELLHRRAAEERMARSVEEFYGDALPPLPIGVRPGSCRWPDRCRDLSRSAGRSGTSTFPTSARTRPSSSA